jgi:hypothetical protein
MALTDRPYFELVREERQFCALLWHLLVSRPENLSAFVSLVERRSGGASDQVTLDGSEELYLEYSGLRDDWYAIGRDNSEKRRRIEWILNLAGAKGAETLPTEIADLNALFIGERGRRIRNDIAYPGSWSVGALYEFTGHEPEAFLELCRIKWAHNIKPDLVILFREKPAIVIEAKLDSGEGSYPTSPAEKKRFDEVFGPGRRRVGQLELQRFLFSTLLEIENQQVVVARTKLPADGIVRMSWREAFDAAGGTVESGFIRALIDSPQLG